MVTDPGGPTRLVLKVPSQPPLVTDPREPTFTVLDIVPTVRPIANPGGSMRPARRTKPGSVSPPYLPCGVFSSGASGAAHRGEGTVTLSSQEDVSTLHWSEPAHMRTWAATWLVAFRANQLCAMTVIMEHLQSRKHPLTEYDWMYIHGSLTH